MRLNRILHRTPIRRKTSNCPLKANQQSSLSFDGRVALVTGAGGGLGKGKGYNIPGILINILSSTDEIPSVST